MPKQCVLCDEVISEKNMTAEHIIPNAIGGRKKVSGFICRDCNSRTGTEWDAHLVDHPMFRFLSLLVKRQKGKVKPIEVMLSNGERGYFDLKEVKPTTPVRKEETSTEKGHHFRILGNDEEEVQKRYDKVVKDYQRRYGRDKFRASSKRRQAEMPDFSLSFDINDLRDELPSKSIVKTMLATVFDAGINPRVCDIGLGYLRDERSLSEEELTFSAFSVDTQGSIALRMLKQAMPKFHYVAVTGDPSNSVIEGCVILFGCLAYHAILSRSYSGSGFSHSYCLDPETGKSFENAARELYYKIRGGLDNRQSHRRRLG